MDTETSGDTFLPFQVEEQTQLRYAEELSAINAEIGSKLAVSASQSDDDEGSSNCLLTPAHASTGGKLQQQMQLLQQQRRKKRALLFVQQHHTLPAKAMFLSPDDHAIRVVYSTLQRVGVEYDRIVHTAKTDFSEESYRLMLIAHKKRRARRDAHPELNTQGIALSDLMHRAQLGQKHKLTLSSRLGISKKRIKMERHPANTVIKSTSVKLESDTNSQTSGDYSLQSVDDLTHTIIEQPEQKPPECLLAVEVKHEPIEAVEQNYEIEPPAAQPPSTIMDDDPESMPNEISSQIYAAEVKEEIEDIDYEPKVKIENILMENEEISNPISVDADIDKKELDLNSIDMMQLPIQLDDGIDILGDVKCEEGTVITIPEKGVEDSLVEDIVINSNELMQETHACFFSLIRDAFLSKGEYRMNRTEMKDAVLQWQDNPISPLNDWYSLVPSWPALVSLALGFLSGELVYSQEQLMDDDHELVPYLENKGRGVYAWIGAGRDSDSRLSILCSKFLLYKDMLIQPKPTTLMQKQLQVHLDNESLTASVDNMTTEVALSNSLPEWEPPQALCPTDWKVRPSSFEEREEFRRQERMRYSAPHKAFTYKMHGYLSVVGPVKGIYQHNAGSGLTKARGHSLLVPDRPNFVTILALVRDATARLPNGEGTRADICQLLKDSQYIQEDIFNNDKEGNLNSVVSGALDRLHYENDPCVRYYPKRKEWLYLHRARSELEFEIYHQQLQGIPKNKKSSSGSSRNKTQQMIPKHSSIKEQSATTIVKEINPKKEKKFSQTPTITRKESLKKIEEKNEHPIIISEQITTAVQQCQLPLISTTSTTGLMGPIISTTTCNSATSTIVNVVSPPIQTTTNIAAQTMVTVSSAVVEKEASTTIVSGMFDANTQIGLTTGKELTESITNLATAMTNPPKKTTTNMNVKPVTVVKSTSAQSLLQSNQQHFPHHQIQVSTSAGLQTIRLSGHSVLQSSQPVATTSVTTIFPNTPKVAQSQAQSQQQGGKSILQASNIKQGQSQHVLPGKTLLASQIKLVSSGQIKSLLTGHGIQGQTIFIKQSPTTTQAQSGQSQPQVQTRVIATAQQSQPTATTLQNSNMQRIIAQIGGKPIAVQIQQSPQQQQHQQQKVLTKVLTNAGTGQLISVESLLAQKGLKLATTAGQLSRQGNKMIQTQYQVVNQPQSSTAQSKIIVSSQATQGTSQQTVRMVTAQIAGKPIVIASNGSGKNASVVLGKQPSTSQPIPQPQTQTPQQQPIILPSQLLNIKALHGLKVIPTPTGLKTTGAAVYARVIAPTTITQTGQTNVVLQQQSQQGQNTRNSPYGASQ